MFSIAPMIYSSSFIEVKLFTSLSSFFKSVIVLTIWLSSLASAIMIVMFKNIDENSLNISRFLPISKFEFFKIIILKQSYFSLFTCFVLIFMMAFMQEDVASFFGYRTYAEEFLSRIILMERFESTLVYASPFALVAMFSAILLYFILKKNSWKPSQDQISPLNNLNIITYEKAPYIVVFVFSLISFFLLVKLVLKVDFLQFGTLVDENISVVLNSFFLSILASFIATVLSVYLVDYFKNSPSKMIFLIAFFSLYWFLPSSLVGLTLVKLSQQFYINYEIFEYIMLVYGYVLKVLPLGMMLMLILSQQKNSSHIFKFVKLSKQSVFLKIVFPMQWRAWFIVFIVLFLLLLNEITTTVLLVPAGFETIIVKIYNLMHYGDYETVAFLSLLQISLIMLGLFTLVIMRGFNDKA